MPRTYHRIGALHPYESNWCIKAKVTRKGPLRSISIRGSDVAIFNVDLVDDAVGTGGGRGRVGGCTAGGSVGPGPAAAEVPEWWLPC